MPTRMARSKKMVLDNWDDPEAEYSALDCGVLEEVMKELCAQGKLKISSVSDGTTYYMLVEDAAVEEEPDEVVPEPEPEEEEEEEKELPEPFDPIAAEAGAKKWVSAVTHSRVIKVDTSECISRYQPPKQGWPVTVKTLDGRSALAREVREHRELSVYITDVLTALQPHKLGRAVTTDDYYNRSYSPSIIYVTAALNEKGELIGFYVGQKNVFKLRKLSGHYAGGFRLSCARRAFLEARTLVVRPLAVVKGGEKASLCEGLAYATAFMQARRLGRADAIFFQAAPAGTKMALTSAPALRDIGRLPSRHILRLAAAEAKKDPNYVVPVSTATKEDKQRQGKDDFRNMKPAARKKWAAGQKKGSKAGVAARQRMGRSWRDRKSKSMGGGGALTASQEKAFLRHCQALGPGVRGSPRWKEIAERMSQKGKKVACKKLQKTYHKDRPLGKDLRRLITKWKWSDPREKVSEFAGVSWDRRAQKWRAQVRRKWVGYYDDEIKAAEACDDEVHAAGLKKKLNFPERRPKRRAAKKKQPKHSAKKPSSKKKKK